MGLTQAHVARHLGVVQQTVDAFEKGRTRVQVYTLARLADLYETPVQDLLNEKPKKRGPESLLEQRIARLRQLPRNQQRTVLAMLDGLLDQAS